MFVRRRCQIAGPLISNGWLESGELLGTYGILSYGNQQPSLKDGEGSETSGAGELNNRISARHPMWMMIQSDPCRNTRKIKGSGKTFALLLECLRHLNVPNFYTLFLRRTKQEAKLPGSCIDESKNIFPQFGGVYSEAYMQWRFENGSKVQFGGIELEKDLEDYKGSQVPLIIFDFKQSPTKETWQ